MIGSVYVSSLQNSDSGLLNLSRLNEYLEDLFRDEGILLPSAGNQFPAAYADGVFLQLSCIVATRRTGGDDACRIATRMSLVRQSIEHLFSFHYNLFKLFQQPDHFRLLVSGVESYKLLFNSFFYGIVIKQFTNHQVTSSWLHQHLNNIYLWKRF